MPRCEPWLSNGFASCFAAGKTVRRTTRTDIWRPWPSVARPFAPDASESRSFVHLTLWMAKRNSTNAIQPGRGFEQAAEVLGADFDGFLVRDGWSIYRQFVRATHQSCLAHLLRRCREMILGCRAGGRVFPRGVQAILQQALQLRDRSQQGQISQRGVAIARGRLETRLDACSSVAGVRPKTGGWRIIFYESARLCSRSSIVLVWRPPTGGQNRPSARWWSRARSGAATAPSPEPERKASWAAFCEPVASNSVLYPL